MIAQQGGVGAAGTTGAAGADGFIAGGRLTLLTGTPLPTSDLSAIATVYYTPFVSTLISLFNGSQWVRTTFAEVSFPLTGLTSNNYDVFIYNNSNVITLELVAWTNITTRATALGSQDGIYVKSGSPTKLYIGTLHLPGTAQAYDSAQNRMTWNMYNRVPKFLRKVEGTANWPWATSSWHAANASAANGVALVAGLATPVHVEVHGTCGGNANSNTKAVGISKGSPASGTSNDADAWESNNTANIVQLEATLDEVIDPGYRQYIWVEWGGATGANATFYGTTTIGTAGAGVNGITGTHWC